MELRGDSKRPTAGSTRSVRISLHFKISFVRRSSEDNWANFLEDLLEQILPSRRFSTQYSFRSGDKVDAVIKLGSSLVPVDAKFPLKHFKRIFDSTAEEEKTRARRQLLPTLRGISMRLRARTSCLTRERMIPRSCIFRGRTFTMKRLSKTIRSGIKT